MKFQVLLSTGLYLFCSLASAANYRELKPEHAFGPRGVPIPKGARMVSEVEFRRLHTATSMHLVNSKIDTENLQEHLNLVKNHEEHVRRELANNPDILRRLTRVPSATDPNVKMLGDGNYQITVTNTMGQKQSIVTMGKEFLFGSLSNAIKQFPGQKNQHQVYAGIFRQLPESYRKAKNLPEPTMVATYSAAQLIALNSQITLDLNNITKIIVLDPKPMGYPASCSAEVGYSVKNTDQTGASCAHNANGLFQKISYPMKWYGTCVKNQGNRGTCVSFGVTASVETKVALKHHKWTNLSEEDLYNKAKMRWYPSSFGDGLNTAGIVDDINNRNYVFPYENSWNYNPSYSRTTDNVAHVYHNSCVGYTGPYCSDTNHQGELLCTELNLFGHTYTFCGYAAPTPGSSGEQATVSNQIWNPANPQFSTALLALAVILKIPATIALPVTPSFDTAPNTGFLNYAGTGEGNRGWHAVQVLGYVANSALPAGLPQGAGGGWFVVKNSWGACWKDAGYIYLPFDWVKNYVGSASLINDVI